MSSDTPPPVTLSDMPVLVLEKVVGKSDLVDCLALQKVCVNFRSLIHSTTLHCDKVHFRFEDYFATVTLGNLDLEYDEIRTGGCRVTSKRFDSIKTHVDTRSFKETMITDALSFLKKPNLRIGRLIVDVFNNAVMRKFSEFLMLHNVKLNVRSIHNRYTPSIHPILHLLNPASLEEIIFEHSHFSLYEFNEIAEMDQQWKAKTSLQRCLIPNEVGIEQYLKFKKVRMPLVSRRVMLTDENLVKLRDNLPGSSHLEFLLLRNAPDYRESFDAMNRRLDKIMSEDAAYDASTRRFLISNSRDYFQLRLEKEFGDVILTIQRVLNN